jgi:hypothetical protein
MGEVLPRCGFSMWSHEWGEFEMGLSRSGASAARLILPAVKLESDAECFSLTRRALNMPLEASLP